MMTAAAAATAASPDFLKPGVRSSSPAHISNNTSWFEFLLKPEQLSKHLSNPYAVPSSNQLIIQFLQQAFLLDNDPKYQEKLLDDGTSKDNEGEMENDNQPEEKHYHQKKSKALKTLALKTACYGGWDLVSLMADVPGSLVLDLLLELLSATTGKTITDSSSIGDLFKEELSDHVFFSLLLYQRWCLHTVLKDCMPKRPAKSNSISVPGLTELVVQVTNVSEEKMREIKKSFGECKAHLSQCLKVSRKACMPTIHCFKFANSAMAGVRLDWESGRKLEFSQWAWQVAYELGCVLFYETDYAESLKLFKNVSEWYKDVGSLPKLNQKQFAGYLKACESLVNKRTDQSNLINRLEQALASLNTKEVIAVLRENFSSRTLPISAANRIMIMEGAFCDHDEERQKVLCCCLIMNAHRGSPLVHQQEMVDVCATEDNRKFLKQVLTEAVSHSTHQEKMNLAGFMRYLVATAGEPLKSDLCSSQSLKRLIDFSTSVSGCKEVEGMDTSSPANSIFSTSDSAEQMLTISYVPDVIWNLLCTIHKAGRLNAIIDIWKLPKDLDRLFNELPLDLNTVCAFVLIAKAKELIAINQYTLTEQLLVAADKTIRDISSKITRIVRWELLYMNLLVAKSHTAEQPELVAKIKGCLRSMRAEPDVHPHDNLVMECVSYLLLCKEWDYLSSLADTRVGFTEYARQLINVCKELPAVLEARAPGTVLWDTTVCICTTQNQPSGKRVRLGNQSVLPKDTFCKFLCTIQEPLVISVLLSLITRLFNKKNTDEDIDKRNKFSDIWPENVPPPVLEVVDEQYVRETMLTLMNHAHSINASQPTWLKTFAEIHFALGNLHEALKYYMQAASVETSFFVQPIPEFLIDEEVYKRLIKCCVQLKHFTQAALLAQFCENNDYAQMFKFLQEKDCQDGMDVYYDCIWDTNLIEYLINMHGKRGELAKKQKLMQCMINPDLNANNPEFIVKNVKARKKAMFFRTLAKQYC